MVLVKKLTDESNGAEYFLFYEQGNITRPLMLLTAPEYEAIDYQFEKEVTKRG